MLTQAQFDVLHCLLKSSGQKISQRELSKRLGFSLGKTNATVKALTEKGALSNSGEVTSLGLEAMEPYRVKNAIIMAAGMSSRFVPLSYEKPKALLRVKDEVLIEREIRQLQEAGITDITVVVGYLKEQLFYLADKFHVAIVENDDYYRYNNTSTLIRVLNRLSNTYICSSDNYFTENPFERYVYRAYYSAVYAKGKTEEYCITADSKDRITKVTIGGEDSWYMLGHVYFDRGFSKQFSEILKKEYENPRTKLELWENLYMRYIDQLSLYIRRYPAGVIEEFDSLEELRHFDNKYLRNADSKIFSNICSVLKCSEDEIGQIRPIKKGLTNSSFCFEVHGKKYVYRHPGVGTSEYINRTSEECSLKIAKKLGLDDTFIYMDRAEGWKISHFVENAHNLDYHNAAEVSEALRMIRKLHTSGEKTDFSFDIWEEIRGFENRLESCGRNQMEDMPQLHDAVLRLKDLVLALDSTKCLCHCDTYDPNFLVGQDGKMYLIDWEYSGMAYRGGDLGTFIACSDYTEEEADGIIEQYLGRTPDTADKCYYYTYICAAAYYWFVWAIYQNSIGNDVGEYLYIWYRYTKTYIQKALEAFDIKD